MTDTPKPLLVADALDVIFDTYRGPHQVLHQVSFQIAPGEILGVVGESGAGKSMTGLAVAGLIEAPGRLAHGSVTLEGVRIDTLQGEAIRRLRGRRIGMVFQDPPTSLNPVLTIGQWLTETIRTHLPLSEGQATERALALLAEVEIPQPEWRLSQYLHQLSGGMRQCVAIALALCADPCLLIADDPPTALDVSVQAQIIALLRRLCRQRGPVGHAHHLRYGRHCRDRRSRDGDVRWPSPGNGSGPVGAAAPSSPLYPGVDGCHSFRHPAPASPARARCRTVAVRAG